MSKADKMFERMGFEVGRDYGGPIYKKHNKTIMFDWVEAGYHVAPKTITIKEHLAIHEKLKELGWLDE